jgi:flagellar biosynthesis component FlhA
MAGDVAADDLSPSEVTRGLAEGDVAEEVASALSAFAASTTIVGLVAGVVAVVCTGIPAVGAGIAAAVRMKQYENMSKIGVGFGREKEKSGNTLANLTERRVS